MIEKVRVLRERLKESGRSLYQYLNRRSGGIVEILYDTVRQFITARGAEAAASMAYYVVFSLFPLLLSLLAIGGIFLESNEALNREINQLVRLTLPVSANLVIENIDAVLKARGPIGIVGAAGLLWSASAAFTTLFRNINRAWSVAMPLNTLKSRGMALLLIVVIGVSLSFSLLASAILDLLPFLGNLLSADNPFFESYFWLRVSRLIPLLVSFLLFLGLYWWIPNTKVRLREAFWAALLAAVAWGITTQAFTWFLRTGIVNYELIYGTLGSVVVLLLWIYLNNMILIFCAHLSAMIAHHTRLKHVKEINPSEI